MDDGGRHRLALHRARQADAERLIEAFNSKLRDECLNENLFGTLAEAADTIEAWRIDYNTPSAAQRDRQPDAGGFCHGERAHDATGPSRCAIREASRLAPLLQPPRQAQIRNGL